MQPGAANVVLDNGIVCKFLVFAAAVDEVNLKAEPHRDVVIIFGIALHILMFEIVSEWPGILLTCHE